jgi:endonuclease/exonuclease/phosphatase family metal-dependent hydrolase
VTLKPRITSLVALALAALMVLAAAPSQAAPRGEPRGKAPAASAPAKPITVMTRNVYLGADINRPIVAAATAEAMGGGAEEILVALANATEVTRDIVDQTDFPVRARLLADEIRRTAPDLIGLQEVALWRSGELELDLDQVGVPNAEDVDYDFLQILLDELRAQGARYTAAVVGERADVEAPSFTGSPFDETMGGSRRDVRLTMHDVILVRDNGSLRVTDTHDEIFAHNLALPVAGMVFGFDRGYQWADVRAGGQSFRFVNTHLEAFSSDLALAQADQMLTEATSTTTSTVIACDCNSDPLNDSIKPDDTFPHKAPYELITGTYTDQWLQWAPAEEGWTSGLNELVDEEPATWTHRIDMIFGRTASGAPLGVDRGEVTGTELTDRDPATGLWPSDHAGVVLRLRGL